LLGMHTVTDNAALTGHMGVMLKRGG